MAEYLILIYADEAAWAEADRGMDERVLGEHQRFMTKHANKIRGGNRLRTSDTATSIRREADGHFLVTDAPFAETKEVMGGYYLIDADDLDDAIAMAKEVPAPHGGVEVRPIWPTNAPA